MILELKKYTRKVEKKMTQMEVNGLLVLKVPVEAGSQTCRHILVKKHNKTGADDSWPEGRTLFVTSLDLSVTEASLKKAMEVFGEVDEVHIKQLKSGKKNSSCRVPAGTCAGSEPKDTKVLCHIVFKHHGSVAKVLNDKNLQSEMVLPLPSGGRKRWEINDRKMYRDAAELQRETDAWMLDFEEREAEEARKAAETVVDEDGFTVVKASGTVTRGEGHAFQSFKAGNVDTGAFGMGKESEAKKKKGKKQPLQKVDFYKFQRTAQKHKEITDARVKKRKDLETVQEMRKSKKFKMIANPASHPGMFDMPTTQNKGTKPGQKRRGQKKKAVAAKKFER